MASEKDKAGAGKQAKGQPERGMTLEEFRRQEVAKFQEEKHPGYQEDPGLDGLRAESARRSEEAKNQEVRFQSGDMGSQPRRESIGFREEPPTEETKSGYSAEKKELLKGMKKTGKGSSSSKGSAR